VSWTLRGRRTSRTPQHRQQKCQLSRGFFEPLFYLAFFVYPLGDLIGDVALDERTLEYVAFVAPG
jgi:hypothetical protein